MSAGNLPVVHRLDTPNAVLRKWTDFDVYREGVRATAENFLIEDVIAIARAPITIANMLPTGIKVQGNARNGSIRRVRIGKFKENRPGLYDSSDGIGIEACPNVLIEDAVVFEVGDRGIDTKGRGTLIRRFVGMDNPISAAAWDDCTLDESFVSCDPGKFHFQIVGNATRPPTLDLRNCPLIVGGSNVRPRIAGFNGPFRILFGPNWGTAKDVVMFDGGQLLES